MTEHQACVQLADGSGREPLSRVIDGSIMFSSARLGPNFENVEQIRNIFAVGPTG